MRKNAEMSRDDTTYTFEEAVDLTQELANGLPTYPGGPVPSFKSYATLAKNGVNLTSLTLGSHWGTHTDAEALNSEWGCESIRSR